MGNSRSSRRSSRRPPPSSSSSGGASDTGVGDVTTDEDIDIMLSGQGLGSGSQDSQDSQDSQSAQDGRAGRRKSGGGPSYLAMARAGYAELCNAIVRPPRADYKEEALGPSKFTFQSRAFTRTDFPLENPRGLTLQCSHWEPVERDRDRIPCVIYMHGNSSARFVAGLGFGGFLGFCRR